MVLKEWMNFKTAVEKNPMDMEAHQLYISNMGDDEKEETRSNRSSIKGVRNSNSNTVSRKNLKAEGPFEIDKAKLKKATKELIDAINRSNKEVFKF